MVTEPTIAAHPSQDGHFYDRTGCQIAEVPNAKADKLIAPDIRHARKLDLARGCTSIIRHAHKPELVRWQQREAIMAALTLPRSDTETEATWLQRVYEDMEAQGKAAAEEGTRVHAAVQEYTQGRIPAAGYGEHVAGIVAHLVAMTGVAVESWKSEQAFVSPLGYGAKIDLLGGGWVIDLKGKDGDADALAKLTTYDEHAMQVAAQQHAAHATDHRGGILFFSRTVPGAARLVEIEREQLERGMRMFRALLSYSFAKDRFRPSWAKD